MFTGPETEHMDERLLSPTSASQDGRTLSGTVASRRSRASLATEEIVNTASMFSVVTNLTNTILGSGMLGLPHAFAECGWLLGSILMVISALSSSFALHLLGISAKKVGVPSNYYLVAEKSVPAFSFWIDVAVAIKCFGVATSYLIVIGDLMPDFIEQCGVEHGLLHSRHFWVLIGWIMCAALMIIATDLDKLKVFSTMAVFFVFFFTFVVIFFVSPLLDECDDDSDDCAGDVYETKTDMDALKVIPIFIFGFTCHQNMFTCVSELKDPTDSRLKQVIAGAIGTAFTLYTIIAWCGFYTYGSKVDSNILSSYPIHPLTTATRLFVSLLVCFSYPLQGHPARKSVLSLWEKFSPVEDIDDIATHALEDGNVDEDLPVPSNASTPCYATCLSILPPSLHSYLADYLDINHFRYLAVTIVFLVISLIVGLSVSDLGVILSIVGATGSTIVSMILPGIIYYKLHYDEVMNSHTSEIEIHSGIEHVDLSSTPIDDMEDDFDADQNVSMLNNKSGLRNTSYYEPETSPFYAKMKLYGAYTLFVAGVIIVPCALTIIFI